MVAAMDHAHFADLSREAAQKVFQTEAGIFCPQAVQVNCNGIPVPYDLHLLHLPSVLLWNFLSHYKWQVCKKQIQIQKNNNFAAMTCTVMI
jgi:hypothetical protein